MDAVTARDLRKMSGGEISPLSYALPVKSGMTMVASLVLIEKVRDIVGLYVNPPERALVLSVDEKSQIQALDRTQPGLPMKHGRGAAMTHDYKRHGTPTRFAALDVRAGTVISQCTLRHRAAKFIRFLRLIDKQTPAALDLHLILDQFAAHKTEVVKRWLVRHPRSQVHVTPTSASWINAVEGLCATLTKRRLKRGVVRSVIELNGAFRDYLDAHNTDPKPFRWTAPADTIIGKHQCGKRLLGPLR